MIDESTVIFEYEEVLLGHKLNFMYSFSGPKPDKERAVGIVWRYAVTDFLGWTPEGALKYMDEPLAKLLCLDRTYVALDYDRKADNSPDFSFFLQYAFPDRISHDWKKTALNEYRRVAKLGIYANDPTTYRYPKKYFLDSAGEDRARFLLRTVVNEYLSDRSEFDRYVFFADKPKASRWLSSHKLDSPVKLIYGTPLDYYHESLPDEEKNELLYYALLLRNQLPK